MSQSIRNHVYSKFINYKQKILTYEYLKYQPQLQGALSLKSEGPTKEDSQKTSVVKATLAGPVTQIGRRERISKKAQKNQPWSRG